MRAEGNAPAAGVGTVTAERLLIDGWLVESPATFPSVNPATGAVVGEAPNATTDQAEAAIAAARRAFDTTSWATDREFRVRCLEQLYAALTEHKEELRELTIADAGASRMSTYGAQLDEPLEIVRYYAQLLRDVPLSRELGETEARGQRHRRWVEKEPAGVVSAIVGYNYPNQLAMAKLAPALAAGCSVVLKGAPDTPLVTLALGRLIAEHTDIPSGVVNVLTSSSNELGELMTTHPDVDVVTFTGSSATGARVMAAGADTIKRVFLELGGKSAMVVLDDADFTTAAMFCAFASCSHAGQGCGITTRLVVPRGAHDAIAELVIAGLNRVVVGDPADPNTYMGPLISERQRDKVDGLVQRAVADGATLLTGGKRVDPGFFYEPTLLGNVDPDSELAQEEVFGPVLAIIPHDGDDDAVRIANNSRYGLSGAVCSGDDDRAIAVARRIRSGTFSINGGNFFAPDAPFGGYKQSGNGREMGEEGLAEFQESKTFAVVAR